MSRIRKEREQRAQEERERRQRLDSLKGTVTVSGQSITPSKGDIEQAVEAIDVGDVVRTYASDRWDHENNTFYDTGKEAGGGPARAMALGKGIISQPGDPLSGERWGMTLDALRGAGYNVPLWIPERGSERSDGSTYEKMPLWALRKAAVAPRFSPPMVRDS